MVLNRFVVVALVAALGGGCGKSLFDNGTGGDDTPGSDGGVDSSIDAPPVQTSCEAPCLGDASGNFDGTPGGANGRWRYLDDTRDRQWTAMTGTTTKVGAGMNKIAKCDAANTGACAALNGALLFTSTGATSTADPAIELTLADAKVTQLSLRVHVPTGGADQVIRLYRGSREDVLFSGTATAGTTLDHSIVIDALAGERILLAMAPMAAGATDVAVQLFATDTQMVFPKSCQLATNFDPSTVVSTTKFDNLCSSAATDVLTSMNDEVASGPDVEVAPRFAAGPYTQQGMATDFIEGRYFDTTVIPDHSGDITMQFWLKFDSFVTSLAFAISDIDVTNGPAGGGFAVDLYISGGTRLESVSVTDGTAPTYASGFAAYTGTGEWHFIRMTQQGDDVNVCVDGARAFQYQVPAGSATTANTLRVGRNQFNPQEALLVGQMDDLRVFKGALPCE